MNPIILLTLEYPPQIGGIAAYLSRLVDCFPPGEIQVLAQKPERTAERPTHQADMESKAPIYRRGLISPWIRPRWLPSVVHLDWLCRREGLPSAVIVSHLLPLGLVALGLNKRRRVPYCLILHGMDAALALEAGGRKRRQATAVVKGAALVVANSRYTASLARSLGAKENRVMIVHPSPAFRSDDWVPAEKLAEIRNRYGLNGKFTVMSAGRIVQRKGFDDAIAALSQLKGEGIDFRYLIVGDGPDRPRLEKMATEKGVGEQTVFCGALTADDLAAAFAAADVFVMASRGIGPDVEGFGIVYLEANLFGCPVIGTRSGGIPDAVIDGQTGILVDPGKPDQLAAAIRRLRNDPDLRQALGRAGRERVLHGFQWQDQCRPLIGAIRHLAKIEAL